MKHLQNPPRRPQLAIARDDAAYARAHDDIAEANRRIIAAAWEAAKVAPVASGSGCPECGSGNVNIFDIEGRRSYACRDCGATWR